MNSARAGSWVKLLYYFVMTASQRKMLGIVHRKWKSSFENEWWLSWNEKEVCLHHPRCNGARESFDRLTIPRKATNHDRKRDIGFAVPKEGRMTENGDVKVFSEAVTQSMREGKFHFSRFLFSTYLGTCCWSPTAYARACDAPLIGYQIHLQVLSAYRGIHRQHPHWNVTRRSSVNRTAGRTHRACLELLSALLRYCQPYTRYIYL